MNKFSFRNILKNYFSRCHVYAVFYDICNDNCEKLEDPNIKKYLLQKDERNKLNLLSVAVIFENYGIAKILIKKAKLLGLDVPNMVNCCSNVGFSPLMHLIKNFDENTDYYNFIKLYKLLIKNGADLTYFRCYNDFYESILLLCVYQYCKIGNQSNMIELVKMVIQDTINVDQKLINAKNKMGNTSLSIAVHKGAYDCAQALLQNGADPNMTGMFNMYPLINAIKNENSEMIMLLLDAKANINIFVGKSGVTPLQIACNNNNFQLAKCLLESNADPNMTGKLHYSPLQRAIKNNSFALVQLLLEYDADLDCNNSGNLMLHPLHLSKDFRIFELLVKHKKFNIEAKFNYFYLAYAIGQSQIDRVKLLLDCGMDVIFDTNLFKEDHLYMDKATSNSYYFFVNAFTSCNFKILGYLLDVLFLQQKQDFLVNDLFLTVIYDNSVKQIYQKEYGLELITDFVIEKCSQKMSAEACGLFVELFTFCNNEVHLYKVLDYCKTFFTPSDPLLIKYASHNKNKKMLITFIGFQIEEPIFDIYADEIFYLRTKMGDLVNEYQFRPGGQGYETTKHHFDLLHMKQHKRNHSV